MRIIIIAIDAQRLVLSTEARLAVTVRFLQALASQLQVLDKTGGGVQRGLAEMFRNAALPCQGRERQVRQDQAVLISRSRSGWRSRSLSNLTKASGGLVLPFS